MNTAGIVEALRDSYRGTRSAYGKECLKLAAAVLAKQISPEEFREQMDTLNARFGKE